jgi:hypothetical protein
VQRCCSPLSILWFALPSDLRYGLYVSSDCSIVTQESNNTAVAGKIEKVNNKVAFFILAKMHGNKYSLNFQQHHLVFGVPRQA